MDIEALLNPVGEVEPIEETSDEEIYSSVMNAQENGECSETAGCDDAGDDPNPTPPPLTPAEALQSISLVIRYLDTINDPTARKAEGLLTTISRHICSERSRRMKETTITNYFPPKEPPRH